jgi:hypothetical protein
MIEKLNEIQFSNEFVGHFKGDESGIKTPRQTPGVFWSKALPTGVPEVKLLAWSDELADTLQVAKPELQEEINILGGTLSRRACILMPPVMPGTSLAIGRVSLATAGLSHWGSG